MYMGKSFKPMVWKPIKLISWIYHPVGPWACILEHKSTAHWERGSSGAGDASCNTRWIGWGTDGALRVAGPTGGLSPPVLDIAASLRRQPEKNGEDPSIFVIALETLTVKAFGDMGHTARLRIIRGRFTTDHNSCDTVR